jgi:DNA ligase (NAD+)
VLASKFLLKLKQIKKEDLLSTRGFGEKLADNFVNFTNSDRFEKLLSKFQLLEKKGKGIEITTKEKLKEGKLLGEIICITGSFEIGRSEIKTKLENLGAVVTDTLSQKNTLLLVGLDAGSKLEKAKKLEIKIETELKNLL